MGKETETKKIGEGTEINKQRKKQKLNKWGRTDMK